MKIEDQICSLEQAIKLRELKVAQKSLYYYYRGFSTEHHGIQPAEYFRGTTSLNAAYSLFTVAELGVMLPNGYDTMQVTVSGSKNGWRGYNEDQEDFPINEVFNTEAECRAAMLITLLENALLTPEECNKRLQG